LFNVCGRLRNGKLSMRSDGYWPFIMGFAWGGLELL
jgi:hypothetical protein